MEYRLCWAITGHNGNRGFKRKNGGFSVQSRGFSVQSRGFSVQSPQSNLPVVVEVVYYSLSSVQMTISQRNCDALCLPCRLVRQLSFFIKVQISRNLEKSLNKPSWIFEKMKKSRASKNRLKIAVSNRQSEVIHKSGQISPLSWLIIEKSHNQNYR